MTTVIFDKETKSLYCDSRISADSKIVTDKYDKTFLYEGVVYSFAGDLYSWDQFQNWIVNGKKKKVIFPTTFHAISVDSAMNVWEYLPDIPDDEPNTKQGYIQATCLGGLDVYGIGSGAEYALGALTALRGTSIKTIHFSALFDVVKGFDASTGGKITKVTLNDNLKWDKNVCL